MANEVTVAQLCSLYNVKTESVEIWDAEQQETVFRGTFEGAACSDYAHVPVLMFGVGYDEFEPEGQIVCIYI